MKPEKMRSREGKRLEEMRRTERSQNNKTRREGMIRD